MRPDRGIDTYTRTIMLIAVDFDGTIVEHRYPNIGKELPFAIASLRKLQEEGHRLILWTAREGELLQEAIDFCAKRGLEFFAINSNYPGEEVDEAGIRARKLHADLFIDDRAVGGLPDWGAICEVVRHRWTWRQYYEYLGTLPVEKKGFLERLFGK